MSGGPNTPRGKAVVALNSVRHGLRTAAIVIPHLEREADWAVFREDVLGSLAPDGPIEYALAARVAESLWRLQRVARAERDAVVNDQAQLDARARHREKVHQFEARRREGRPPPDPGSLPTSFYAAALIPFDGPPPLTPAVPAEEFMQPLIRYEAHLNRQLYSALHELQALQDRRDGRPAPLARVEVHGLPET